MATDEADRLRQVLGNADAVITETRRLIKALYRELVRQRAATRQVKSPSRRPRRPRSKPRRKAG